MSVLGIEDIELCVKRGLPIREEGHYAVKISKDNGKFETFVLDDPVVTGRQLVDLTHSRPIDEHLVFLVLRFGGFEELRLNETVDLRSRGAERFMVFASSASYRFVVDGERYEWGTTAVTGHKIKKIAGQNPDEADLWQENRGGQDTKILDEELVDLSRDGLERFYTLAKQDLPITIIVNAREKVVSADTLSFDDLVRLAFDRPPSGPNVCFTITFRDGPPERPEGSIIAGQSIKIREGMVFNVTCTDKS